MEHYTYKITIRGTVQGVGFRPFVYALAQRYLFHGTVSNNSEGVVIFLNVDSITLQQLLTALEYEAPLLANIQSIKCEEVAFQNFESFEILQTQEKGTIRANIPPDMSSCSECEQELFDPTNRRYRFPFITCTQCGVRYSIIKNLPYDRKNTSMAEFTMCKLCEEEYTNPLNRRYHAQPIGCWDCGPQMLLKHKGKELALLQEEIVVRVVKALEDGNIVAIKGVGGYHIMCDATNDAVVRELRKRKQRPEKPFAVLVRDIHQAKLLADISLEEEKLLTSKERPIVLLDAKPSRLSPKVAPNISRVGIFLAYTPLHLLILDGLKRPLIATSANISNEPICSNLEDMEKIEGIYDYLLDHDREVVNACDDSVVMVVDDRVITLRRARGYAPSSIEIPTTLKKNVLALGANQKSTVAIAFENRVILSPHIGDLKSISSVEYYKKTIQTLKRVYKFEADLIVHDKHPQYESTKVAQSMLEEDNSLEIATIGHHYAHILGVMAEKGLNEKVFGVAFDGTGYG
ncbi:MAG TPA: carbamoyltransferase HypF, partial [Sulfurimonas autotrophica]|nr:carbamoyltransferase HypF [Sulfurimonas autotrophica]